MFKNVFRPLNEFLYESNMMFMRLSIRLYLRISLIAEPIWFSFSYSVAFIGPGKVYNYFGERYNQPQEIPLREKNAPLSSLF